MYLCADKSTNSGASSVHHNPDYAAIDRELRYSRNIEEVIGHAINLLGDAANFAREINWKWDAQHIAEHAEALRDEILPEVKAGIAKLEAKIRP